jgi:hypothetical protein
LSSLVARFLPPEIGLTFCTASATVHGMMRQMVRPNWFYAYFTPPVLSAGVVALT